MAFKTPVFNLWAQVYRFGREESPENYSLLGYTKCQLRGPDSHWDGGTPQINSPKVAFEALFPVGSDIRGPGQSTNSTAGDVVVFAGLGQRMAFVRDTVAKGAGFTNEYLLAICVFQECDVLGGPFVQQAFGFGRVNTALQPPDDAPMVPVLAPVIIWANVLSG